MGPRGALLALALVAWALPAGTAAAAGMDASPGADPVEDVLLPVEVSWSVGTQPDVVVVAADPAAGCAGDPAAEPATGTEVARQDAVAGGQATLVLRIGTAGARVLCGYVVEGGQVVGDTGPVPVSVRAPRSGLSLRAPEGLARGVSGEVALSYTTEAERELFLIAQPGGGPCPAATSQFGPGALRLAQGQAVQGDGVVRVPVRDGAAELLTVCAYLQEDAQDPTPDAVVSAVVQVGRTSCERAQAREGRARSRLAAARRARVRAARATTRARRRGEAEATRRAARTLVLVTRARTGAMQRVSHTKAATAAVCGR